MQDLLSDERLEPSLAARTGRARMLRALRCQSVDRPPLWLMRQAGRCLPEYRALRKNYSFTDLIRNPELACEVTLQPVRRFKFDAAILFSDILVIPEALGQGFRFRETGGVEMDYVLRCPQDIGQLDAEEVGSRLQYVAEALKLIKKSLGPETALLGFAGSPWTLANFMLDGGSSQAHHKAWELYQSDRPAYEALAEKLRSAVTQFLEMQIDCGADAIQLFDSLGGLLPASEFEAASGRWMREIIETLRGQVPIIVYSKGTRNWDALRRTGANVIGVDHGIDLKLAEKSLPSSVAIQGNLDPELLATGGPPQVAAEATRLLCAMQGRPGYVFNLGHGVPPNARMENLETLAQTVQDFV